MSFGSKDTFKMHPVLCTNTYSDVTDLVKHGIVKNTKKNVLRIEHNFSMKYIKS